MGRTATVRVVFISGLCLLGGALRAAAEADTDRLIERYREAHTCTPSDESEDALIGSRIEATILRIACAGGRTQDVAQALAIEYALPTAAAQPLLRARLLLDTKPDRDTPKDAAATPSALSAAEKELLTALRRAPEHEATLDTLDDVY